MLERRAHGWALGLSTHPPRSCHCSLLAPNQLILQQFWVFFPQHPGTRQVWDVTSIARLETCWGEEDEVETKCLKSGGLKSRIWGVFTEFQEQLQNNPSRSPQGFSSLSHSGRDGRSRKDSLALTFSKVASSTWQCPVCSARHKGTRRAQGTHGAMAAARRSRKLCPVGAKADTAVPATGKAQPSKEPPPHPLLHPPLRVPPWGTPPGPGRSPAGERQEERLGEMEQ